MKNNKETDRFKQAVRSKVKEAPVPSVSDAALWEKVLSEIKPEPKVVRLNYIRAAAAGVLLVLSASLFFYLWNSRGRNPELSHHTGQVNQRSREAIAGRDRKEVTEDFDSTSVSDKRMGDLKRTENKSSVSTIPDFSKGQIYQAGDKVITQTLQDGSLISVNAGSRLVAEKIFGNQRNVMLEGEAYFEISPDKAKPFAVYFSNYRLIVVGTKFNIRNISKEESKEITVLEGIVRVYDPGKEDGVEVRAGEQLIVNKEKPSVLVKVDASHFISWKTGNLDFKKARLEEVATLLSRRHQVEIILSPEIKKM